MKEEKIDTEKAKKTLMEEKKKRADACNKDLVEMLQKHNCTLEPYVIVSQGSVKSGLQVIANDNETKKAKPGTS